MQTLLLTTMASCAAILTMTQPDPKWGLVWLMTAGLYGALAYALH